MAEADRDAGLPRAVQRELTGARRAVRRAWPGRAAADRSRIGRNAAALLRDREERIVARFFVHGIRLLRDDVIEDAEADRVRLELVDVRHVDRKRKVADVQAALQRDLRAVAGAVDVRFGVAEVARETLTVLAAAAVRDADARGAGALFDHGPHERDDSRTCRRTVWWTGRPI